MERHFGMRIAGVPGIQCLSWIRLALSLYMSENPSSGSVPVVGTSMTTILSIGSGDSVTWNGGSASVSILWTSGDELLSMY